MLTKDEAEIYDRQIRLWGLNAQSRLRQSRVLMLGFNGVASEVAKILVLAGIDTLTIVDDQELTEEDLCSNLFCRTKNEGAKFRTHAVEEKLKTLNPLVKVNIDNSSILEKSAKDFKKHDLVTLHSFINIEHIASIDQACLENSVKFYLVLDYGCFGFMFNDLGREFKFIHEQYKEMNEKKCLSERTGKALDPICLSDCYDSDEDARPKKRQRFEDPVEVRDNKQKSVEETNEKQQTNGTLSYPTFKDMISLRKSTFDKSTSPVLFISIAMLRFYSDSGYLPKNSDDLSNLNKIIASIKDSLNLHDGIFKKLNPDWSQYLTGSLSPVCAIVGGVAGQDMIRALSGKDVPIYNTFSFDGLELTGFVSSQGDKIEAKTIVRDVIEID